MIDVLNADRVVALSGEKPRTAVHWSSRPACWLGLSGRMTAVWVWGQTTCVPVVLVLLALLVSGRRVAAADLDEAPIFYATAETHNAISELQTQLQTNESVLAPDARFGYLRSVLTALDVPVSSQVLVFTKTSLQRSRIGPRTPRAIYFNDEVTIGYCHRGEVLEVAVSDPNLGTVYHTLGQDIQSPPELTRQTESCLICHGSSRNQGFPGHLVRSVSANRGGELVLSQGTKFVDHSTPIENRWGGWYVTGSTGSQPHMGNRIVGGWPWASKDEQPSGENVTDLKPYFDVTNYLSPHSDVVSLMVLEHQGETQNRLTRANFLTRLAFHEQADLNQALGEPPETQRESITQRIHWACEPVVEYLLFCDEAQLTEPVLGTSEFSREFTARGPFDSKQRSLREFDLHTRMFKYPLSYLIYSQQFDGLPVEAKERIYRRLWEVLSGQDESKEFAHLTAEDKRAVLEILQDTKPDLPAYWKE